jgi:hypothetical protein
MKSRSGLRRRDCFRWLKRSGDRARAGVRKRLVHCTALFQLMLLEQGRLSDERFDMFH